MQQIKELIPTNNEITAWLVSTLKHACHVEYFLGKLNLGQKEMERPHDLVGPGNKFEWGVVKGMALLYRDPKPDFKIYVLPSIVLHRQQYHHRMWNDPDPTNESTHIPEATEEDMLVGAVDAACSLLESRRYAGGKEQNEQHGKEHSWIEVEDILYNKNPLHKVPWAKIIVPKMKVVQQPNLDQINSLNSLPNIGLEKIVYDTIVKRINETVEVLKTEQGYLLD